MHNPMVIAITIIIIFAWEKVSICESCIGFLTKERWALAFVLRMKPRLSPTNAKFPSGSGCVTSRLGFVCIGRYYGPVKAPSTGDC